MENKNSSAIITLCSNMCMGDDVKPLETKEWSVLAGQLLSIKKQPSDLFDFSCNEFKNYFNYNQDEIERIERLLGRSGSLTFEIEKLKSKGIEIVTRADKNYPCFIRKKLALLAPPLFYYAGDLDIAKDECMGFVGSRSIEETDIEFTKKIVKNCVNRGFTIVSGGAKGIDKTATEYALDCGGVVVEYLSDSLNRRIKTSNVISQIQNGKMLLLSASIPDAGFNVGLAMQRNKYIYAQSSGTVVVKSDFEKGGTWAGAIESLKMLITHIFCWDNDKYKGNKALISKGAIPISDKFDPQDARKELIKDKVLVQQSFFEKNE